MPLLSLSISQLLLAFVSASILHKLTFNRFFLGWLASHQFLYHSVPSNSDLKKLRDGSKSSKKANTKHKHNSRKEASSGRDNMRDEIVKIPAENLKCLQLETAIVDARDLELMVYSVDLEWIADLALMSLFSFAVTEIQFQLYPQSKDCNFSLLWILIVVLYSIRTLGKLTSTYFKNDQSIGERSICMVSGCVFLFIAMIVLMIDERRLEFGLNDTYRIISASLLSNSSTLAGKALGQGQSFSVVILTKLLIAMTSSLVGVVFTFPGLRFGQIHVALMERTEADRFARFKYSLNYLGPLLVVCLWIKTISRDPLRNQEFMAIGDDTFDTLRIYCIIIVNLFRFSMLPAYISVFLESAGSRIARIRCRGGTTTNKEIRMIVSSIYSYINVIAIQYTLPVFMCLYTAIMYKTLTGQRWIPKQITDLMWGSQIFHNATVHLQTSGSENTTDFDNTDYLIPSNSTRLSDLLDSVDINGIKKAFSPEVTGGLLGFATWWLHFSWLCTSTAGFIYHSYFKH